VPDKRAIELNNLAAQLFQEGKTDSALILLDRAIQIDSNYFIAYSNKCTFLWQLNRNEEALRTARKATQIKEAMISSYFLVGIAYERVGHLDSARAIYAWLIYAVEQHNSNRLLLSEKTALVEILTVAKGKESGLNKFQEFFGAGLDTLPPSDLSLIKYLKNEIVSYQGGGMSEFQGGKPRQYCIATDRSKVEVLEMLLDKGINVQGIVSKEGGYYIRVYDSFRPKVLALGLVECGD
jgi:tetratricopeptide (TPR) repeat protein